MHFFHTWGPWNAYKVFEHYGTPMQSLRSMRQRRKCTVCGKLQDALLANLY